MGQLPEGANLDEFDIRAVCDDYSVGGDLFLISSAPRTRRNGRDDTARVRDLLPFALCLSRLAGEACSIVEALQILLATLEIWKYYGAFVQIHYGSVVEPLHGILLEYEREGSLVLSRWVTPNIGLDGYRVG